MLKTYFLLRKDQINKDNTRTVYIRIYNKRVHRDLATPVRVLPKYWNQAQQRISGRDWDSQMKNRILDTIDRKAKEIVYNAFVEGKDLTVEEFIEIYRGEAKKKDLFEIIEEIMQEKELTPETRRYYKGQIGKLKKFKEKIYINDIDKKWLLSYKTHMELIRGNNQNTAYKSLAFLKSVINRAIEKGYIKDSPFKDFKIKTLNGSRQFLTKEELKRLDLLYDELEEKSPEKKVLRYFLFNCYAGLRYSDLKELTWKQLKSTENGRRYYIETFMHKTKRLVIIPLAKPALKYLPERKEIPETKIFRVFSNQVTNRYLHKAAELAGIEKPLTTHIARHTFATLAIEAGIPLEVVSELLGHTQIKTTQIYAKITLNKKVSEIKKLDDL